MALRLCIHPHTITLNRDHKLVHTIGLNMNRDIALRVLWIRGGKNLSHRLADLEQSAEATNITYHPIWQIWIIPKYYYNIFVVA